MNKCVFEKLVGFLVLEVLYAILTAQEIGKDDTRCAQGRNTHPSAGPQHLFAPLSFVYYVKSINMNHVNQSKFSLPRRDSVSFAWCR